MRYIKCKQIETGDKLIIKPKQINKIEKRKQEIN
jgi:hypothetical protein